METKIKTNAIELISNLHNSFIALENYWLDNQTGMDELCEKAYPFTQSLDEVRANVGNWLHDVKQIVSRETFTLQQIIQTNISDMDKSEIAIISTLAVGEDCVIGHSQITRIDNNQYTIL